MPANFPQDVCTELAATAKAIASPGKGILAADESTGTIGKRFAKIDVENIESNRSAYRELLFKTKDLGKHISGAILFEETFLQSTGEGEKMVELLVANGIIPGIKVDLGVVEIPGTKKEMATAGLDGLGKRCAEYYKHGARFTKWRAVLSIDTAEGKPSPLAISETAHTLARYAAICQENKLVPIVEPEILSDGSHTIEECAEITEKVLAAVFKALNDHHILLEGCLLKPNMVTAGADCKTKASHAEIAFYTVRTLRRTVPPALPGVMFLSGGQSEEEASLNLSAMNQKELGVLPWILSFSYGRALQSSVLKAWGGKKENTEAAQAVLLERAKANSDAQLGQYKGGAGGEAASASLYTSKYVY